MKYIETKQKCQGGETETESEKSRKNRILRVSGVRASVGRCVCGVGVGVCVSEHSGVKFY